MFPAISSITLLFPLGLLALLAIPLILWLHLRRERSRVVVIPSLLLWQQLPRPSSMKERRWLPLSLLLLLQLFIAALFALVLSQPQGMIAFGPQRQHLAVIIDVSTSMAARNGEGDTTRLDVARTLTKSMLNDLGSGSLLTLIAAGPRSRLLFSGQPVQQHTHFRTALDNLTIQGQGTDIREALLLAQTMLEAWKREFPRNRQRIVVVSDLAPPTDLTALSYPIEWKRIGQPTGNQAIVAFHARPPRPNTKIPEWDLYLHVANYGTEVVATHLRLTGFTADGQQFEPSPFPIQISPGAAVDIETTVPASVVAVEAILEGEDVLPLDNVAYLNLRQVRPAQVLLVSEHPELLERILKTLDGIQLFTTDPAKYGDVSRAAAPDLTIFDSVFPAISFWPAGNVLVIFPPADGDSMLLPVTTTSPVRVGKLHVSTRAPPWLKTLNLEGIAFGPIARMPELSWGETMLAAAPDGELPIPLIIRGVLEERQIVIWTFGLHTEKEGSNLLNQLAFPLLVAQTIRELTRSPFPASVTLGDPLVLHPAHHADKVAIYPPQHPPTWPITTDPPLLISPVSSDPRPMVVDTLLSPGLYPVVEWRGETILTTSWLAVNAGSPIESNLQEQPAPSVAGMAPPSATEGEEFSARETEQQPLWSWVALGVLALLMVEWLLVAFHQS